MILNFSNYDPISRKLHFFKKKNAKKFQCLQKGLNCQHNFLRDVNFFRQTVVDLEKNTFLKQSLKQLYQNL